MTRLRSYLAVLTLLALDPSRAARAGDTTQKIAGPSASPTKATTPTSPVMITKPANNALVTNDGLASGTFDSSIKDDIWVFVCPAKAPDKCWPQSPDASKGAPAVMNRQKSEWSTPVGFGGPPQSYEIAVYTASKSASAQIGKLLQRWATKNDYQGLKLDKLAKLALVERHRITVRKP